MGVAQTVINWRHYGGEKDVYFNITLSTNTPNKIICYDWQIQGDDGTIKREMIEHRDEDAFISLIVDVPLTFKEFKVLLIQSGIPIVAKKLCKRMERKIKNDPAFRPSKFTDDLLVKALNTLSQWEKKQLFWTTIETDKLS